MSALELASDTGSTSAPGIPSAFWTSLRYFNAYRIFTALLFLFSTTLYGTIFRFGDANPQLFLIVSGIYMAAAIVFQLLLWQAPRHFTAQLSAHVLTDILAITLLTYASGGFRSGLEAMLLVSLAAAALVSHGRLILFFAAMATIAVLLEQSAWVVLKDYDLATFMQPGLISIGFFATALILNQLAKRVIFNEQIARARSADLANQQRVNQLVIRDLQDGVLVVDARGRITQRNPKADGLGLPGRSAEATRIEDYCPALAKLLAAWREGSGASATSFAAGADRKLRVRFIEAGVTGGNVTVIYLEDESKLEDRARQVKLAALGRLTVNIAHEIRNPLSAIVHAADLMDEENRAPARVRLSRIMRDNAARLDRMVKDVLELNRVDRAQRETIALRAFVAVFIAELEENQELHAQSVQIDIAEDASIGFDRIHLHQVLWNLVRNAWRHSQQTQGSVSLVLRRESNRLELHVRDDGEGVPPHLQAQLFEPFFTTYSGGTGLGLYISRELCSANGATLDYVAGNGGGDFRIAWQS